MRIRNVRAEPDLRSALLMLGTGHLRRSEYLPGQCDLFRGVVRGYWRYMRGPGVLPRRSDLSGNCDLRHEHMSGRRDLSGFVFLPRL